MLCVPDKQHDRSQREKERVRERNRARESESESEREREREREIEGNFLFWNESKDASAYICSFKR